jgi:hypothetical protein
MTRARLVARDLLPALLPAAVATAAIVVGARNGIARGLHQGPVTLAVGTALPVLLGVAIWAAIVLRPALRGRLTALLISLGGALVGVEIGIRTIIPAEYPDYFERAKAARAKGVTFDRRSQVEVAIDMRRAGARVYPIYTPASVLWKGKDNFWTSGIELDGHEIVPLGGVARARTLGANESGQQAQFTSDEMGLNNPAGLWDTGPVDVVLIGDSFGQGWGVDPEHNIAAPVRARWSRTLNFGVTGAGPMFELGQLRELGPVVKPKVVLWLYYEGNDLLDLHREARTLLWKYRKAGFTQDLYARRDEVSQRLATFLDRRIETVGSWWWTPLDVLRLRRVRALVHRKGGRYMPRPQDFEAFAGALGEADKVVRGWGGTIVFAYLPSWGRFATPGEAAAVDADRAKILATARALGMPVVDLVDAFAAHGDPLDNFPYRLHGHYNARGYGLVGRALADHVAGSKLLEP